MKSDFDTRLAGLGLQLPDIPAPRGKYAGLTVHNGIAYVSGQVSRLGDEVIKGPIDQDTPAGVIKLAAETCILRALSALTAAGEGYAFDRILFLRGYVNAIPAFTTHSAVLDGASDLLHALFGERGRHARSAIGVASLPSSGLLEIELVAALTARSLQDTSTASTGGTS
jgi:enamine deaminase RidA (YjgF/YER057c/UK114 family)